VDREELMKFWRVMVVDSPVVDGCKKLKENWENQLRHIMGITRPTCLLLASNDTVPVLVWHSRDIRSNKCHLVISAHHLGKCGLMNVEDDFFDFTDFYINR